ncbi:replication initiator protein A [Anaerostipes sp.]|uniref:replication initiator protein A n=1 Tax=Anaerostipes sp. TaxID=1872530 RepID=UPI00302F7B36|nr:replication initiator protein A [Anaerostipes sp.]
MNKYFTISEAQCSVFYKVPKGLFTDDKYKKVSTDAKKLYALLLDRMYLVSKERSN